MATGTATGTYTVSTTSTMPAAEPTGWTRVFAEDFTTAVALGGWTVGAAGSSTDGRLATSHPYYSKLNLYPDNQGYAGDLSNGRYYTSKTVSTTTANDANGVLDWYWHSETVDSAVRALSGWVRPIVAGETQQNRLGGRFSVRMRADTTTGYGGVQLLISDNWPQGGEEDWPEGPSTDAPVHGFRHFADPAATSGTSGQYQQQVNTPAGTAWSDWHIYTIEWIPGIRMRYLVDGVAVHDSTDRVPSGSMKYVIQSGINGSSVPPANASGHLQVDWMTVANYSGASASGTASGSYAVTSIATGVTTGTYAVTKAVTVGNASGTYDVTAPAAVGSGLITWGLPIVASTQPPPSSTTPPTTPTDASTFPETFTDTF